MNHGGSAWEIRRILVGILHHGNVDQGLFTRRVADQLGIEVVDGPPAVATDAHHVQQAVVRHALFVLFGREGGQVLAVVVAHAETLDGENRKGDLAVLAGVQGLHQRRFGIAGGVAVLDERDQAANLFFQGFGNGFRFSGVSQSAGEQQGNGQQAQFHESECPGVSGGQRAMVAVGKGLGRNC